MNFSCLECKLNYPYGFDANFEDGLIECVFCYCKRTSKKINFIASYEDAIKFHERLAIKNEIESLFGVPFELYFNCENSLVVHFEKQEQTSEEKFKDLVNSYRIILEKRHFIYFDENSIDFSIKMKE